MSLDLLRGGAYQIFNVMYSTQGAELLYPGGVNGVIGGYHNNSDSGRMQWVVEIIAGSPFGSEIAIQNEEIRTYAGIPKLLTPAGTPVQGQQAYGQQVRWAVSSIESNSEYVIYLPDNPSMVWTLGDGNDSTPITLEEVSATDSAQANQQWTFVPL